VLLCLPYDLSFLISTWLMTCSVLQAVQAVASTYDGFSSLYVHRSIKYQPLTNATFVGGASSPTVHNPFCSVAGNLYVWPDAVLGSCSDRGSGSLMKVRSFVTSL
jgi:hypothetical protein